jgi:hypothetical protein
MKLKQGTTSNRSGANTRDIYNWLTHTPASRDRWAHRVRELLADSPSGGTWGAARVRLAAEIRDALPGEYDYQPLQVDWNRLTVRLVEMALASGAGFDTDLEWVEEYSRAEAISDGVLVDASELAREAGFRFPVALTSAAWAKCVEVPHGVPGQDERGRLWDVLTLLRVACRSRDGGGDESVRLFDVLVLNDRTSPKPVRLKAVCGPDDDLSPCVTVMLPGED